MDSIDYVMVDVVEKHYGTMSGTNDVNYNILLQIDGLWVPKSKMDYGEYSNKDRELHHVSTNTNTNSNSDSTVSTSTYTQYLHPLETTEYSVLIPPTDILTDMIDNNDTSDSNDSGSGSGGGSSTMPHYEYGWDCKSDLKI